MPVTTLCPKCVQAVSVPENLDPAAEVRCPRCEAQYTLSEALAAEAPRLIVLSVPATAAGDGELSDIISDAESGEGTLALADQDATVAEMPDWNLTSVGDSDAADQPTLQHEDGEAETSDGAEEGAEDISWETSADEGEEEPAGLFAASADTAVGTTVAASKTAKRTKRRGPGLATQVGGIVVFGFVGIVMGYLILKWMKAPAADEIDRAIASVVPWWGSKSSSTTNGDSNDGGGIVEIGSALGDPASKSAKPPIEPVKIDAPKEVVTQPAPPPVPPVEAPPAEIPFSGPLMAQQVTAAELESALSAASKKVGKQPKELAADEFIALCDLGHGVAVVEETADSSGGELRRSAALLLRQASPSARRGVIGIYTHKWLFDSRRNRPGVWMVGEVEKIQTLKTPKGNLVETVLAVRGKEQTAHISVLTIDRPDYQIGETAGVLGTIVNDPTKRLTWYTGDRPIVVLGGVAISLPQ